MLLFIDFPLVESNFQFGKETQCEGLNHRLQACTHALGYLSSETETLESRINHRAVST